MIIECPECGCTMTKSKRSGGYYMCQSCGCQVITKYGKIVDVLGGPDDYDDFYDDGPGEGCRACGNPDWPKCLDACPMGE